MGSHKRELDFAPMMSDEPISARCSVCRQVFLEKPTGDDKTDDLLLRIHAKFEQHDCNLDSSQNAWAR